MRVLVLGASVTGGGGVGGNASLAWPALLVEHDVTVHFKNAVGASHFLHCSSRYVHGTFDAALFDFGPNMWSAGAASELATLIGTIAHLSLARTFGLVNWPRRGVHADARAIRHAANLSGAAAIEIAPGPDLYAESVHPNVARHVAIARAVRAFLRAPPDTPVRPKAARGEETCFQDAVELPVLRSKGWKLLTEWPLPTVFKRGWATSHAGAGALVLGVPISTTCGSIVTLEYLRTNASGAFEVHCGASCPCAPLRGYHQRTTFPFPHVATRVREALRVTDTTSFSQLRAIGPGGACVLEIRRASATPGIVRIDGMFVKQPSAEDAENAANGSGATAAQRAFGEHARSRACGGYSTDR